jgi:hypothetical protein
MAVWRSALLLLLLGVADAASSNAQLRGVSADQADKYALAQGKFKCLDGSKTIPAKQVNDNYCDCPDGSDEPGVCWVCVLCARWRAPPPSSLFAMADLCRHPAIPQARRRARMAASTAATAATSPRC